LNAPQVLSAILHLATAPSAAKRPNDIAINNTIEGKNMNPKRHRQPSEEAPDEEVDFLTPEQRLNAVAEILATIALRIVAQEQDEGAVPQAAEEKPKRKKRRKKPPQ